MQHFHINSNHSSLQQGKALAISGTEQLIKKERKKQGTKNIKERQLSYKNLQARAVPNDDEVSIGQFDIHKLQSKSLARKARRYYHMAISAKEHTLCTECIELQSRVLWQAFSET